MVLVHVHGYLQKLVYFIYHVHQNLSISVEIPLVPFYQVFWLDLSGKTEPQSNGDDSCFLLQGKLGLLLEFRLTYLLVFITTDANL